MDRRWNWNAVSVIIIIIIIFPSVVKIPKVKSYKNLKKIARWLKVNYYYEGKKIQKY